MTQFARNGDVALAFDVEGDGDDLLLIAGTASTRALWGLVRPALATTMRTIAFDNRDAGDSTIASAPYTLADLAADAIAVLDAAGSQRAHIAGHSLGGAIAQELALTYPDRVASLTLVSTWARGDRYAGNIVELLLALTTSDVDERTLLAAILYAGAGESTLRNASLFDMTDAAMAMGSLAPRAALARQWKLDLTIDLLDRIPQLRMPVHVIYGSEDRLLPPRLSQQIVAAVPGATIACIDGTGHLPMIHAPDAFVAELRSHLTV